MSRHYAKRPFNCWCQTCSRVRGRGLGSQSSGPHLLVSGCTRTKQTAWIEDQFTVTSSAGIRNREKRVADIVVRELKRAKPGVWGCIQAREVWSSEEETNMRPGHFRICKWEEYKVTRYSDGDSALFVNSSDLHGSEVSSTRRGGSRRPSYARCGSEKSSGCG